MDLGPAEKGLMGLRDLVAQARARFLLDGVQGSVYRVDREACELTVAAGRRLGERSNLKGSYSCLLYTSPSPRD